MTGDKDKDHKRVLEAGMLIGTSLGENGEPEFIYESSINHWRVKVINNRDEFGSNLVEVYRPDEAGDYHKLGSYDKIDFDSMITLLSLAFFNEPGKRPS